MAGAPDGPGGEPADGGGIDVARVRAETPGCEHVVHLDNAGAALPPSAVLDATVGHLLAEATIGGYPAAERARDAVERTYDAVAALVRADRDEIALVENATRAWDMAFYSLPFRPGERILTGRAEYRSNVVAFLHARERTGVTVDVVPDDEHGQIDVGALRGMLDERVRLIALTHVPTNGGLVNPAAEVGAVAREAGVPYLLDACQSAGQLDLDVSALGCDMLSATGRKYLRGPRGTGFLYVRRELCERLVPPLLDLHAAHLGTGAAGYRLRPDARRFETWESFVAGRIGLGVAVDYALRIGLPAIERRVGALAERLRSRLGQVPGVTVRDTGARRCGIVTFDVDGRPPAEVKQALARSRVNVSTSLVTGSVFDRSPRAGGLVRASVHYYNTLDEIDLACASLASALP